MRPERVAAKWRVFAAHYPPVAAPFVLFSFGGEKEKRRSAFHPSEHFSSRRVHNTTAVKRILPFCLCQDEYVSRSASEPCRSSPAVLRGSADEAPFLGSFLALLTSPYPLCSSGRVCPCGPGQQRSQRNTHGLIPVAAVFCTRTPTFTHTYISTHTRACFTSKRPDCCVYHNPCTVFNFFPFFFPFCRALSIPSNGPVAIMTGKPCRSPQPPGYVTELFPHLQKRSLNLLRPNTLRR